GVIAAAALPLLTQAYRIAQANVVAPFEYTAMIWGVLYGWLVFDQLPQSWAWMGIALIGGAGIFVLSRERRSPSTHIYATPGARPRISTSDRDRADRDRASR